MQPKPLTATTLLSGTVWVPIYAGEGDRQKPGAQCRNALAASR